MSQITFGPGDLVFAEGGASDFVLRISEGEAEAVKVVGGQDVVLGRLRAGDFIGEMGVLEGRPRGATVRAVSGLTVERLGRDDFLAQVSRDSDMALKVLVRLSERLNALGESYADLSAERSETSEAAAGACDAMRILLRTGSEIMTAILPRPEIPVEQVPFTVGRTPAPGEAAPLTRIDLMIDDTRPFRLSRAHFRIEAAADGYHLRDLGSVLGTQVNGLAVGHHFSSDTALLREGDNEVIAGGQDSPFRFHVTLSG